MGFFDDISKTVSHGLDRAKFEAEKFQRSSRVQGEISDLKRKLDSKMIDLGLRAYDLYRAGQIDSPSVAELVQTIDELRAALVVKEEHLQVVQAESYVEPPESQGQPRPSATTVPVEETADSATSTPQKKVCPVCEFEMSQQAVFCPNCGYRVGS